MPEPYKRTRKIKKVKRRTPGGATHTLYRKAKVRIPRCGNCKSFLSGTLRYRSVKMHNMPKSMKRPQRPFGGNLCSKCMRRLFIEKSRK